MDEEEVKNPLPSTTMQKDFGRNDATTIIVNRIVLSASSVKESSTEKNDKEELEIDDTYDLSSSNSSEEDDMSPSKLFDLIYSNDSSDVVLPQSSSTKNKTVECKSAPTTTQTTISAAATNDDAILSAKSDRQSSEKITTPEPPRWRFINEAKKSLGYSSIHAGSYIKGKSSDDLGAKYVAPDISIYNKQPKNDEVGRLKFISNRHTNNEDYTVQVGKRVSNEQDEKEGGDDGKSVHSDMIEGGLFVDRTDVVSANETCNDVESCTNNHLDANIEVDDDNDLSKAAVVQQTNEKDLPTWKKRRCMMILLLCFIVVLAIVLGTTLKRNGDEEDRSAAAVLFPPVVVSNETNTTECPIDTKPFKIMHPQQYSVQASEFSWELKDACTGLVVASCLPCSLANMSESQKDSKSIQSQGEPTRRHLKDDQLLRNSADECLPINNAYVFSVVPADEPCCGFDATFSILLYDNVIIQYGTASDYNVYFGEREKPCVSEIPFSIEKSATPSIMKSQAPSLPPTNVPTTSPVVYLGPCPEAYILLSYYSIGALVELNGIVYECVRDACGGPYGAELGSSTGDLWRESWKVTGSCSGTKAPSTYPTISPTSSPSTNPTATPISQPTDSPTGTPSVAPSSGEPTSVPTGTDIGLLEDGTFNCTSPAISKNDCKKAPYCEWDKNSCFDVTPEPTTSPSETPTMFPSKFPTSSPLSSPPTWRSSELLTSIQPTEKLMIQTETPTKLPSKSPTGLSSNILTSNPTCSIKDIEQSFNLCLAVDMSGSVCNDGDGSDCNECTSGPTLFGLPIPFFGTDCRDSFVSEDTCCSNFANVKGFSSTMVNLLGDIGDSSVDNSFSVVQFATNAQLVSSLASADQTVQVIDQLDYTGGLTNHASAIQACQQTLPSNDNSRKNFIMLITDGVSSEPGFDPEGEALAAARVAKSEGTFIIPVFISPYNDMSALSFMSQLSSDGKVFDVTDFDSLSSLQDSLITQVSCS